MGKTKTRTQYLCRECGSVQMRWMGKCPDCGVWDALEKYTEAREPRSATASHAGVVDVWAAGNAKDDFPSAASGLSGGSARALPLPEIESANVHRLPTGIDELDRVLGGGLVPGSVVLLGGDPGIGKSTLLLQAAGRLARSSHRVLYATSEESAFQTRLRAERLFKAVDQSDKVNQQKRNADASSPANLEELSELYILADTNLARIVEQARQVTPQALIIDSIQMVYKPDLEAAPGSITQLRRCCMDLVILAKVSGMAIVLVGHITKDGQLAGPKLLEHLVDAVLSFEGDRHHAYRIVRGMKNRFGTTQEVGLFEMTGGGLMEIDDLAALPDPHETAGPGTVLCPAMHGSRCLLVEIQALTATGFLGSAKRKSSGVDTNRLSMLIAVLEKHGGLRLADQDVFASVAGGMKIAEPAADLALALAIAGAHYRRCAPAGAVVIGEVGLGGEIRPVGQLEPRIREAVRHGYRTIISPKGADSIVGKDAEVIGVRTISDAIGLLQ